MWLLNSWKWVTFWELRCLFTNGSIFPGDDKCSRGCSDDPRRGLRLQGGLRIRLSVHHQENPQPHPGDAQTPPHPAAGGDVLAAPEDGWFLPHLLPAKRQAVLQGYVPNGLRQILGRPHAPFLGLNPPVAWWQNQGPTAQSASHQRGWHVSYRATDRVGALAHMCVINDCSSCLMDNRKISSTLKLFMALRERTRGCWETACCVFTWKWWNFIWHVQNDLRFLVLCIAVFCWTFRLYWTTELSDHTYLHAHALNNHDWGFVC